MKAQSLTFHTFAESKAATDTTSLSIPTPAGTVAGDLLIAAVATDGNNLATLFPPSGVGWTLISRRSQSTVTFGVWWKTATGSEPPSHLFNWTSSEQAYGWMMRFAGHDPTNPIDVFSERGGTANLPSSPSVTTTIDNTLILRLGGFDGSAITLDSTGLSGHTTITMDRSSNFSGSASGGAGFVQQPLSGFSGLRNFSLTNSQAYRTVTLAIAPFACSSGAECSDGDPCTDDVCTSGVCSNPNNTAPCSDGDPCTEGDACSGGVCVSGGSVDCSGAGGFCNTAACDPVGLDGNCDDLTPVLNGTPCDLGACIVGEFCTNGVCSSGAPRNCAGFGDQCNDAACDPGGSEANCSTITPKTNGTPCDDIIACTIDDSCQAGLCTGGGAPDCSGAGDQCNAASCNPLGPQGNCETLTPVLNGTPCDLGACTVGEFCTNGVCAGGVPGDCSEFSDQCNDATCDPGGAEGNCAILIPKSNGTPCDDFLTCNIGESCQSGVCSGGGPPDCSGEGDECNTASCNPLGAEGNCDSVTPVSDGVTCNDMLFCTANDTCQSGSCMGTGDPCGGQPCDETNDLCIECLVSGDCDDADACTTEACNAGLCEFQPIGNITIDLELRGLGSGVIRSLSFVIVSCSEGTVTLSKSVSFDNAGIGSTVLSNVNANSEWISVREGHTLRRLAALAFTACAATVDMTGAAALDAGDFQTGAIVQDNIVDITDFSILASRWNMAIDATLATGADATGDGLQATADFTAIQNNFFKLGDALDGCVLITAGGFGRQLRFERRQARLESLIRSGATRIPTVRLGIPHAMRADINADGIVDIRDIRLFAQRNDLTLRPEFDHLLKSIERLEMRRLRR